MKKLKLSYWKWIQKIINTIIMWLIIPFIAHELLINYGELKIASDTFFAVFIVLFAIKFQYALFNPPVILMMEPKEEEEKE